MRLKDLRDAINIITNYIDETADIGGTEHDIIWLGHVAPDKMNNDDVMELAKMGFIFSSEEGWYGFT